MFLFLFKWVTVLLVSQVLGFLLPSRESEGVFFLMFTRYIVSDWLCLNCVNHGAADKDVAAV